MKDAGSVVKSMRRLISIQKLLCGFEFLVFQSNVFKLGLLFKLEMTSGIKVANDLSWPLHENIARFRHRSRSKRGRIREIPKIIADSFLLQGGENE